MNDDRNAFVAGLASGQPDRTTPLDMLVGIVATALDRGLVEPETVPNDEPDPIEDDG